MGALAALQFGLFTLVPLVYIPVCRSALALFDCTSLPNGRWALDANLGASPALCALLMRRVLKQSCSFTRAGVYCFDDEWWYYATYAGIPLSVCYVLGLPALIV